MGSQHQNMFESAGGPWTVRFYQRHTLTSLFGDLAVLEKRGLHDAECEKIQAALRAAYALVTGIPGGSLFYSAFWEQLRQLSDLYEQWNGPAQQGRDAAGHRRDCLQKMIKLREKMLKRAKFPEDVPGSTLREEQLDLAAEMTPTLADQLHRAFKRAAEAHPDLFPLLRDTLLSYEKRSGRGPENGNGNLTPNKQ
jgi:hypothetical protein